MTNHDDAIVQTVFAQLSSSLLDKLELTHKKGLQGNIGAAGVFPGAISWLGHFIVPVLLGFVIPDRRCRSES